MSTITFNNNQQQTAKNRATKIQTEQLQEEYADRPFTGEDPPQVGGYFQNPGQDSLTGNLFSPDRMETPITEEEKNNPILVQLVETDEYKNATTSEARQSMIDRALTAENIQRFRDQGEPGIGGPGTMLGDTFGVETRTQQVMELDQRENPDYDPDQPISPTNTPTLQDTRKRTYIVPKPGAESTGFQRTFAGGILEFGKALGESGEYVTDAIGITDPETDFVSENFPTYPAASGLERVGQEVTSIIAGATTGAGVVAKLNQYTKLTPRAADFIAKRWDKAKQLNPENFKAGMELFLRGFLIERGASAGATVATPETAEPFIGDSVVEFMGLDPEENRNLSHYIDNEAFSAAFSIIAKTAKLGKYLGSKVVPSTSKSTKQAQREVALQMIREIDPNISDDLPMEELIRRAKNLGDVLKNNAEFTSQLTKEGTDISLDTGTAVMLGAEDYVRRTYLWMEPILGKEAFEVRVKEMSADMVNRIAALKRSRVDQPIVAEADNVLLTTSQRAIDDASDEVGGRAAGVDAATDEAERIVEDVATRMEVVDTATTAKSAAEKMADATRDSDTILNMLEMARSRDALGSDQTQRMLFREMTGEDLYSAWRQSYNNYNQAFDDLPAGVPVDLAELRDVVKDLAVKSNEFATLTITSTKEDAFVQLLSDFRPQPKRGADGNVVRDAKGNFVNETPEEVVERLEGMGKDLKFLYTNLRPEISRRLKKLADEGLPTSPQLISLREFIDDAAANSGDEAFVNAKNMYADHEAVFGATDDLAAWESRARTVSANLDEAGNIIPNTTAEGKNIVTASGSPAGMPDLIAQGYNLLQRAEVEPSGALMGEVIQALRVGTEGADEKMASAYAAQALKTLLRMKEAGQKVTASDVNNAIGPYLAKLEATEAGAAQAATFRRTITNLQMVDNGLATANTALANSEAALSQVIKDAEMDMASVFVSELGKGNMAVRQDLNAAFNELFSGKDAPDKIARMLEQYGDNPAIVNGLKAHWLTFVGNKIRTAQRRGASPTGGPAESAFELSANQLDRMLTGKGGDSFQSLNKQIFADDPRMGQALEDLLQVQNFAVNNRAYKLSNFGSNTAQETGNRQKVDRLIIMTLGVLNPLATKARNVGRIYTDMKDAQQRELINTTVDMMLASPTYMKEALDLIDKGTTLGDLSAIATKHFSRGALGAYKNRVYDPTYEAIPVE